jgi:hypothetical protein
MVPKAPSNGKMDLQLLIMSENYIGCDKTLPLKFKVGPSAQAPLPRPLCPGPSAQALALQTVHGACLPPTPCWLPPYAWLGGASARWGRTPGLCSGQLLLCVASTAACAGVGCLRVGTGASRPTHTPGLRRSTP